MLSWDAAVISACCKYVQHWMVLQWRSVQIIQVTACYWKAWWQAHPVDSEYIPLLMIMHQQPQYSLQYYNETGDGNGPCLKATGEPRRLRGKLATSSFTQS